MNIRLADSHKIHEIELSEAEAKEIPLRSVVVEQGCVVDDWSCLGNRKVQLFEEGQFYSFADGPSDSPLFFMEDQVLVGIEGGRDIRYRIGTQERVTKLRMGKVVITPQPTSRHGYVTDLLRVEAGYANIGGVSLDLPLDKPTELALFEGKYQLASFSGSASPDAERRKNGIDFSVNFGRTSEISLSVFSPERKSSTPKKSATATQKLKRY